MAEGPACYSCSVSRLLRDVSPVTPGYEIRSFECPNVGQSSGWSSNLIQVRLMRRIDRERVEEN